MSGKVSIIVPVYNVEKYLPKCIESILNQTYTNLEVILIDDGSTDSSGKICDEYARRDGRIKVIHKENGGNSSARNAGLDCCTGDFLAFVDSDDWIEENMFESMMKDNHYDMTVCAYNMYVSPSRFELVNPWLRRGEKEFVTTDVFHEVLCRTVVVWNKIMLMDRVKDLRFAQEQRCSEDIRFLCEALKNVREARIICEPYYNYYAARPGNVVSAKIDDRAIDLLDVSRHVYDELKGGNYGCCGVYRIRTEVDTVWRRLGLTGEKAPKETVDYCVKTIRYPAIADIVAFLKDSYFGKRARLGFVLCYIAPRLYGKLKYKVKI